MIYEIRTEGERVIYELKSVSPLSFSKMPYDSEDGFFHIENGCGTAFGELGYGSLRCYITEAGQITLQSPEYEAQSDRQVIIDRLNKAMTDFVNYTPTTDDGDAIS
jgi:hypothetical protein